jgi:hypothetical protein
MIVLPIILEADGRWYVGPGISLFELVQRRAGETRSRNIDWKPERLSASFHGRDLFAPVAAVLARGVRLPAGRQDVYRRADWPDDRCEIVIVGHDRRSGLPACSRIRPCIAPVTRQGNFGVPRLMGR